MRKVVISLVLLLFFCQPVAVLAKEPAPDSDAKERHPCDQVPEAARGACEECAGPDRKKPDGMWTGIGCISTNPVQAVGEILGFIFGVGGFLIFVHILIGAFGILVSKGNPKALQDAREKIINSIIALLFVIFSITLLELIGVKILKIPGFFDH